MQSAACQQTSSRDVPKFVVISSDEISAAYRRRSSDKSSHCQLRTVRWSAHWWYHKELPAVMETKSTIPISQQRTTCPYVKPD
jgi:hypothetical protein